MDCGTTLVKYILFIFNTLVAILGILAIIFGVITLESIGVVQVDNNEVGFPAHAALAIGIITIGSIVVFISFLGCCGAIREDVGMTMCYAVFILIALILQVILVVFLWINKKTITEGVGQLIDIAWEEQKKGSGVFEGIQGTFKCCGVNGATDYIVNAHLPPPSCCPLGATCQPFNYYSGCQKVFSDFMSDSSDYAKYFGIGLISIELVGFIFACCLANNIRNYKRRNDF